MEGYLGLSKVGAIGLIFQIHDKPGLHLRGQAMGCRAMPPESAGSPRR
jgi:hypothetical protein